MNGPMVSVLMTAYNREQYIGEAIESVLESSYTNFELIITDDQSKDRTVDIAKTYAEKDSRVKIFINEVNLGDYPNRNKAASYATGKYLKYVDSDDLIYPHGLGTFVFWMEKNPDAALGLSSHVIQQAFPFPLYFKEGESFNYHFFKQGILDCGPSGAIIRRDRFEELGGFSGQRMLGDTELWMKMAGIHPVIVLPPALIFWRQHEGQEFYAGVKEGLYLAMNLPLIRRVLKSDRINLTVEEKEKVLYYFRKSTARGVLNMMLKKRKVKEAYALYKKLELSLPDFWYAITDTKNLNQL